MSSTQTDRHPTFESISPPRPCFTEAMLRVRWILDFEDASMALISVLNDCRQPDGAREPYATDNSTCHHEVSQAALTEPKVSEITVTAHNLEEWSTYWLISHGHAELGVYGEFDDDGGLIECCGEAMPPDPPSLTVNASNGSYITIDDYITNVHPWLMGLKSNILQALAAQNGNEELPDPTRLEVLRTDPAEVYLDEIIPEHHAT